MMKTHKLHLSRSPQQGAALVTSLVILLVLTVLGISAMKNSSLQENIVGNLRDRDLAFQSAEAALTSAEKDVLIAKSVSDLAPNDTATNGVFPIPKPTDTLLFDLNGSAHSSVWNSATASSITLADVAKTPSFIIQKEQFVPDSYDPDVLAKQQGLVYYRVTSRGYGTSTNSVVLLQEVFGKRNR